MIRQAPMDGLVRVDKEKFLSAFSMRDGNVRIGTQPWELGPGWTGDDVRIGKIYENDFDAMSEEQCLQLWNSDTGSDLPFGNEGIRLQREVWKEYKMQAMQVLPICHASGEVDEVDSIRHGNYRRIIRDQGVGRKQGEHNMEEIEVDREDVRVTKASLGASDGKGWKDIELVQRCTLIWALVGKKPDGVTVGRLVPPPRLLVPPSTLVINLLSPSLRSEVDSLDRDLGCYKLVPHFPSQELRKGAGFGDLAKSYSCLSIINSRNGIEARIIHQDLLLLRMVVWEELTVLQESALRFLQEKSDHLYGHLHLEVEWFTRLALDIRHWLELQAGDQEFRAETYLTPDFLVDQRNTTILRCSRRQIFPSDPLGWVMNCAREFVVSWMGLVVGKKQELSSIFIREVYNRLGVGALALGEVWRVAENVPLHLLGTSKTKDVDASEVIRKMCHIMSSTVEVDEDVMGLLVQIHKKCFSVRDQLSKDRLEVLVGIGSRGRRSVPPEPIYIVAILKHHPRHTTHTYPGPNEEGMGILTVCNSRFFKLIPRCTDIGA
ncbi:hypothetical protein HHX47_DHR8000002 [Lentinula edodes]|nr:hypothetical protein HHX47_DHR8000002 [Lentinula edodes]